MKTKLNRFKKLPGWLSFLIEVLLVALIGYVDYLTGDYSILMFYAIPIGLAAWSMGDWGAVVMAAASGYARYISDDHSYSSSKVIYWNTAEDILFLLIVGLLISAVKRLLEEEKKH